MRQCASRASLSALRCSAKTWGHGSKNCTFRCSSLVQAFFDILCSSFPKSQRNSALLAVLANGKSSCKKTERCCVERCTKLPLFPSACTSLYLCSSLYLKPCVNTSLRDEGRDLYGTKWTLAVNGSSSISSIDLNNIHVWNTIQLRLEPSCSLTAAPIAHSQENSNGTIVTGTASFTWHQRMTSTISTPSDPSSYPRSMQEMKERFLWIPESGSSKAWVPRWCEEREDLRSVIFTAQKQSPKKANRAGEASPGGTNAGFMTIRLNLDAKLNPESLCWINHQYTNPARPRRESRPFEILWNTEFGRPKKTDNWQQLQVCT